MAEHAAAQEEAEALVDGCLAARGWETSRNETGGFGPFDGSFPVEQFLDDADQCAEELGFDPHRPFSREELQQRHGFMLDIYSCLIAHGVELELAPASADAWVEQFQAWQQEQGTFPWHPYFDPGFEALPWEEVLEMQRACPEPFVP